MQISGLVTGLDTASLVTQLIAVERQAGSNLTTGKVKATSISGALTTLNGLVKSLKDAATALVPDNITKASAWSSTTATTSDATRATAATDPTAKPGLISFTVGAVASAGSVISSGTWASSSTALAIPSGQSMSFDLVQGAGLPSETTTNVSVASGATLQDLANAINGKKAGVTANVVKVADGDFRLQLTSQTTGAATNLTLNDASGAAASTVLGAMKTVHTGSDAQITVGDGPGAYTVTSSKNTFAGIASGLTITALKADPATSVTVNIGENVSAMADKVQALVDAANSVLSNIRVNSKYDAASKTAGILNGNSEVRDLSRQFSDIFSGSLANLPSIGGVSIDRDGGVTFDKEAFTTAYAEKPTAVTDSLTKMSESLVTLGKQATAPVDGTLTLAIAGQTALIKDYTDQIAKFEDKMTLRQSVLQRQYSALDTMLSKLKSQSDWLTSQLSSLSSSSNSSN